MFHVEQKVLYMLIKKAVDKLLEADMIQPGQKPWHGVGHKLSDTPDADYDKELDKLLAFLGEMEVVIDKHVHYAMTHPGDYNPVLDMEKANNLMSKVVDAITR